MTTRLYHTDAYRTTFAARVLACDPHGERWGVVLDATAFYPASGGQPHDTGTLGGAAVREVIERGDGAVVHLVETPPAVGALVEGLVDWPRRFDHMQQHTGQHILSAAFDRLFGVRTESFHLGAEVATIDLAREVSPDEIAAAESEANRVVWEDRPVHVRFASAEEAAAMPLRKEPARGGLLRLVEVEAFDLSACGGTHVARTGAVGMVAVTGWEKVRRATRVEFGCGARALGRYRRDRDVVAAVQRLLSAAPHELAAAVDRLQADQRAAARAIRRLQEQLAGHEARALVARGVRAGGVLVAVEAIEGWDAAGLCALASAAVASPGVAVALFTTTAPAQAVVARSPDVDLDAAAVLRALVTRYGGRGGGRPDLAQGGGFTGTMDALIETARALLRGA